VNKKTSDNKHEGLILFDSRDASHQSIIMADQGEIIATDNAIGFNLINGHRQSFNKSGAFEILSFDKFRLNINSEKSSEDRQSDKALQEHYIWELLMPDSGTNKSYLKLFAEGNNRLVWPMLNLILPLVAISVFLRSNFNRRDYMKHVVRSFFVAMIFVVVHFIFLNLALKHHYLNGFLYLNMFSAVLVYRVLTSSSLRV
jgi:lipopolysaccharide export LptBFGC system permease protein LptF